MPPRRRYPIEQPATQDKGAQQAYGSQQRALDTIAADLDAMETDVETYAATATDWAAPAPTTQDAALTRLAAAVAGLLGTPVP